MRKQQRYCTLCGNNAVRGDRPCPACSAVVKGPLKEAYKLWKEMAARYTKCCGSLSSDKDHLFFHGKYFDDAYPKITRGPHKGYGVRRGPHVSVEHGVSFYADHAQPYFIRDFDHYTDSMDYGNAIPYSDPEFWEHLAENFDYAAEAAFNSDILTCRRCGYHYDPSLEECPCRRRNAGSE